MNPTLSIEDAVRLAFSKNHHSKRYVTHFDKDDGSESGRFLSMPPRVPFHSSMYKRGLGLYYQRDKGGAETI
uniref:Uncharacterized protein n=1 Tax=viral metagenome TaxID=1070528 RepID=A0A6C0C892_9ZZZZ